jgi:hypothetical protein
MKRYHLVMALVLSQLLCGSPSSNAMMNGQNALGDERVVGIIFGNTAQRHCSGALLAPRIVATSAHCVLRVDGGIYSKVKHISGELPVNSELFVSAPGVEIPKGGTQFKSKVIAQYVPEDYTDSMCEGTDCNAGMSDVAILILEKELSQKTFRFATKEEILLMKSTSTLVLAIGYGIKSDQDWQNAVNGIGYDGNPTKSEALTRTNYCCAGKKVEQWSTNNPSGLVQTVLPRGIFQGGGDSGSPLWINIRGEWVYVGAEGAAQGPVAGNVPATSPRWSDPFELSVVGGSYFTIAGNIKIFTDAEKFLAKVITAEEKAAADFKAKQEADENAASELKAKQEAETKAAADLKAKEKLAADAKLEAAKILAAAKATAIKKITITCVRGKLVKMISGVKPMCPSGYKKR